LVLGLWGSFSVVGAILWGSLSFQFVGNENILLSQLFGKALLVAARSVIS
jgi:hypothetical protein